MKQVPGDVAKYEINFQEAADELQYEGVDDTAWNSIQDHLGFSTTFEEYVDVDKSDMYNPRTDRGINCLYDWCT